MIGKHTTPHPPALGAAHVILAAAACAGLTWLLYSGTLHAPFVYDDVVIFSEGCRPCRPERLAGLLDVVLARGLPRPVTMLSFALNHYVGGPHPYGYHLVNLALHALVGTVLFVFSCRLLMLLPAARAWRDSALPIAAVGTLVWLVHPVHSQVAAYVWQRSTSHSALFFLGSLLAYLEARWGGGGHGPQVPEQGARPRQPGQRLPRPARLRGSPTRLRARPGAGSGAHGRRQQPGPHPSRPPGAARRGPPAPGGRRPAEARRRGDAGQPGRGLLAARRAGRGRPPPRGRARA